MDMNRRKNERHETCGLMSSIWDGKSACIGVIDDVSTTGIKVSQIPSFIDLDSGKFFTIVHGPLTDVKMMLRLKWKKETQKDMYLSAGFQVLKPTYNWKQCINKSMDTLA